MLFRSDAEGGLLGGLGQLFKNHTRLYVYPGLDFSSHTVTTVENFPIEPKLRHIYEHLRLNDCLRPLSASNPDLLRIRAVDVIQKIGAGDGSWEKFVPEKLVNVIRSKKLFGCES